MTSRGGTSGGYYGEAHFKIYEFNVIFSINVIIKEGKSIAGEYKLISRDFAPNYGLQMLPEEILVREKIEALMSRKKPRDFYDVYFLLRNRMIPVEMRELLHDVLEIVENTELDFRRELDVFLPSDHQSIIGTFRHTLAQELRRNIGT